MATVDDLAGELADEVGDEYSDTDVAAQFQAWVAEVYEEIVRSGRWFMQNASESYSFTSGTRTKSLNAATAEIRTVIDDTNGRQMGYTTVSELAQFGKSTADSGFPTHWYFEGVGASQEIVMGVWPVPASTISVRVVGLDRPDALASSSTVTLPRDYIGVLRHGVRALIKANDGNDAAAQVWRARFDAGLELLNARFGHRQKADSRLPANQLPQTFQGTAASGG